MAGMDQYVDGTRFKVVPHSGTRSYRVSEMSIETTYSQARAGLASLMNRVTEDREVVVVRRRNHPPVAMIAADELVSLVETAHLLRSPANAERLLAALSRSRRGEGTVMNLDTLHADLNR